VDISQFGTGEGAAMRNAYDEDDEEAEGRQGGGGGVQCAQG
jgi:hypothetical protein